MKETSEAGSDVITLSEPVDWKIGEEIAIASSDFENRHAE